MYVAPVDIKILHSDELYDLLEQYYKKFGEEFIVFNYVDFPGTWEKPAAQVYKETLEKAVAADEPTRIESRYIEVMEQLNGLIKEK